MKFRGLPLLLLLCATALWGCQTGPRGAGAGQSGSPLASASPAAPVAEPTGEAILTIEAPGESRTLTRRQLLDHPALRTLTLRDEAAFRGQTLTVKAIPVTALFEGLPVDEKMTIEFDSLDGFSASLDPGLLLNRDEKKAIAFLAVEEPDQPWPKLGAGGSAGPLYMIWQNAGLSDVGQEQWPFQLRSLRVTAPVDERFPGLLPEPGLAAEHPVRLGYQAFTKNCLACHTLNGEGSGRLGPDLNEPYSPTEYMHEEYLRKFVRDPQSVRHWKGSRMSGFSEQALSQEQLDHIIVYLKHKAEQRRAKP